ncbi:prolyl aminopeptidase serine peptidase [Saitoella complicata NRRL Y-17804]|nr:prolyl aminopeptidase serine peptidase [Saitoella complicata NRRL Y-17804]ODQ53911.1 prolyl aminopeptidase serine peptidase [Saitoella complicata NRRL Y-17804]
MLGLYPEIEPFDEGTLLVSDIHTLYYEQSGKPDGKPVVYLHGGPGGGTSALDRRYFDPEVYRIVLFDQRGSGKSEPSAELRENTTWDIVEDIEKLRKHFGIDKWVVFGGSWGSTLALSYAQTHPDRVKALILRGIFTLRKKELDFFYQFGTSMLFPEAWDAYTSVIPESERDDFVSAYYKRLTSDDEEERSKAACAWSTWEVSTSRLQPDPDLIAKASNDKWALAFARIEAHYFKHAGFFPRDGYLLEDEQIAKMKGIPAVIVQGRYDVVCPASTAWTLHKKWEGSEIYFVGDAGHSAKEEGIASKLVEAADKFKEL